APVISVKTRIRYRHKEAASTVTRLGGGRAKIYFPVPQDAITPGQAAVFYEQDRVIGTGWIER
ncbi:MAG: tRNA 2-thiouridine(34) synthase MnmA, partial [Deltaproteobacteria bacterium]|nr:tRNA 2-thiouridine(34) synthase MnmA [Deltaproteobacteria bacterium]